MDGQRLDDQLEPIYSSSVPIRDGAWKTSRERWTIETGGERVPGRSVLVARHDDDDDCHVVSHWDDRNKITTILVFELTVASRQRMTVKNRCLYLVTSLGSPDTERKRVEAKRLAGTLKRKWHLLPVSEKKIIRKLVVGQGSWRTEPKAKYSG